MKTLSQDKSHRHAAVQIMLGAIAAVLLAEALLGTVSSFANPPLSSSTRAIMNSLAVILLLCPTVFWLANRRSSVTDVAGEQRDAAPLLTLSPDMQCLLGGDGSIRRANPALECALGFHNAELAATPFLSLVEADDRPMTEGELGKLAAGAAAVQFENRCATKAGDTRWLWWTAMPVGVDGMIYAVGRDISERKQKEEGLEKRVVSLQRTFDAAMSAMVFTVEMRDPNTAGHERRTAELAAAIARALQLSDEQVAAVRLAAVVHDIGKVNVPVEILSKPDAMSEVEFSLIRAHPQVGYAILQPRELPWPVAQAVLQHHERLDGSGYPQGLKGDEILLEARIIGVADVVEAMVSNRSHRSALGIDKALDEVTRNSGRLYDLNVVDACLNLFRKSGFEFDF